MRQVGIVGVGHTKFGKHTGTFLEMISEAALQAMDDAGAKTGDNNVIDQVFVASMGAGMINRISGSASALVDTLDIRPAMAECIENGPASGARLMVLSNALRILLLTCRHAKRPAPAADRADYRIATLLRRLDAEYPDRWSLERMAESTGFPIDGFRHRFRKIVGAPPMAWLLELRLEKAELLLRTGTLSVAETAAACGFSDSNYFSTRFSRHFGCSPRQYRLDAQRDSHAPRQDFASTTQEFISHSASRDVLEKYLSPPLHAPVRPAPPERFAALEHMAQFQGGKADTSICKMWEKKKARFNLR